LSHHRLGLFSSGPFNKINIFETYFKDLLFYTILKNIKISNKKILRGKINQIMAQILLFFF